MKVSKYIVLMSFSIGLMLSACLLHLIVWFALGEFIDDPFIFKSDYFGPVLYKFKNFGVALGAGLIANLLFDYYRARHYRITLYGRSLRKLCVKKLEGLLIRIRPSLVDWFLTESNHKKKAVKNNNAVADVFEQGVNKDGCLSLLRTYWFLLILNFFLFLLVTIPERFGNSIEISQVYISMFRSIMSIIIYFSMLFALFSISISVKSQRIFKYPIYGANKDAGLPVVIMLCVCIFIVCVFFLGYNFVTSPFMTAAESALYYLPLPMTCTFFSFVIARYCLWKIS